MKYIYVDGNFGIMLVSDTPVVKPNLTEVMYDFEEYVDKTDAGFKEAVVRAHRDNLLIDSDALWIEAMSKANGTAQTLVEDYKNALRDIPSDTDFSETLNWLSSIFPVRPVI